jgi:uncharacterized protein DUF4157
MVNGYYYLVSEYFYLVSEYHYYGIAEIKNYCKLGGREFIMSSTFDKPGQPQRGQSEAGKASTPAIVDEVLRSPGQPLDHTVNALMQPRFLHDFSNVRIHTDEKAARSAAATNARAYTFGRDIVFGAREYAPDTMYGQMLIAHELAHVVQQQAGPKSLQGKLNINDPGDAAERSADEAARRVMAPDNADFRSTALSIRHSLLHSSTSSPLIQRAVKSWGGEFDTDKYELIKTPGLDGVSIDLKFHPNKYVDAELIGLTQTARSTEKGSPVPASTFYGTDAEKKAFESYRIPGKDPNAGTMVDQLVKFPNPMYATGAAGAKDTLASTPTGAQWGTHGFHFTDKAGKLHEKDAHSIDGPTLSSAKKETKQVFESTALAIKGTQEGTYYGSVQWGWEKNAAGKVDKLPFKLVSNDVPSEVFAQAAGIWNKAKTSTGSNTIALPVVEGKYTNTEGVWLVSNPANYKATIIGKLKKNTRVEATSKGEGKSYNKTAEKEKWWKATVVDGTFAGKVGWVMQADLSDAVTK